MLPVELYSNLFHLENKDVLRDILSAGYTCKHWNQAIHCEQFYNTLISSIGLKALFLEEIPTFAPNFLARRYRVVHNWIQNEHFAYEDEIECDPFGKPTKQSAPYTFHEGNDLISVTKKGWDEFQIDRISMQTRKWEPITCCRFSQFLHHNYYITLHDVLYYNRRLYISFSHRIKKSKTYYKVFSYSLDTNKTHRLCTPKSVPSQPEGYPHFHKTLTKVYLVFDSILITYDYSEESAV